MNSPKILFYILTYIGFVSNTGCLSVATSAISGASEVKSLVNNTGSPSTSADEELDDENEELLPEDPPEPPAITFAPPEGTSVIGDGQLALGLIALTPDQIILPADEPLQDIQSIGNLDELIPFQIDEEAPTRLAIFDDGTGRAQSPDGIIHAFNYNIFQEGQSSFDSEACDQGGTGNSRFLSTEISLPSGEYLRAGIQVDNGTCDISDFPGMDLRKCLVISGEIFESKEIFEQEGPGDGVINYFFETTPGGCDFYINVGVI